MAAPNASNVKAYLELVKPPSSATGGTGTQVGRIDFRFNPDSFSFTKSAQWNRTEARAAGVAPAAEFQGTKAATFSVEMFLDAHESSSNAIPDNVALLMQTLKPLASDLAQDKPQPPWVIFGWGTALTMTAIVTSLEVDYTMFDSTGTPLRAKVKITMEEMPTIPGRTNPTSGGLSTLAAHVVKEGDSLASIAYRHYGNPALWRALANVNNVDNPARLRPGSELILPSRPELEGLA
ncbi:MAG: LysM peptidoglycan-binding domain-containing protein [Acidimicrobiales bacterium]